ncbi:uncharacterized protein LOC125042114 [Penaeus chinensis]|uniref:uncharacterized protein LOC125042114 n=1 Tax=Penaeus chinensis TaxID=139456 RepID=UPI001FB6FA2E|nr:uncharacterized protein LOC125042114 [Penaeus chinensis]
MGYISIGESVLNKFPTIFPYEPWRHVGKRRDHSLSSQQTWKGVKALIHMRNERLKSTLETKHLSIPIRLTYYVDFFLKNFPRLVDHWEKGRELKPTIVLIDGGLHHIAKRADRKGNLYEKTLQKLVPYFTRLASSVPVYYKLIDDTQATRQRKFKYSEETINLVNRRAVEQLQGTGVIVWDSTVPLSVQYTDACLQHHKRTPPMFKWKCDDIGHLGYIFVDQVADMLYNAVCNKYLDLDEDYCGYSTDLEQIHSGRER